MRVRGAHPVRGIEGNPAELGHEGLGPGVAVALLGCAVVAADITSHIARGNAEAVSGSNKNVGEICTIPAPAREGLGGGHRGWAAAVMSHTGM